MAVEKTLALIKPDAVSAGHYGKIIDTIAQSSLDVAAIRKVQLKTQEAGEFYAVHRGKPFYEDLVSFMSSGPLFALVLTGENAIAAWRTMMGATNFEEAEEGTIRKRFATSIGRNAVHGSDSRKNAAIERAFFFSDLELCE
ncbi:MAG: nucleoside-diphosphate kinase [Fibrobacterota bacterium]